MIYTAHIPGRTVDFTSRASTVTGRARAALMIMLSGLNVYETETHGIITRASYRVAVEVQDVYDEAA